MVTCWSQDLGGVTEARFKIVKRSGEPGEEEVEADGFNDKDPSIDF